MGFEFLRNIEDQPERREGALEFYERAKTQAESFLSSIDPELQVEVVPVVVTPYDRTRTEYPTFALRFSDPRRPELSWTMEIEQDDAYLAKRFEGAVRRAFEQQTDDRGDRRDESQQNGLDPAG